MTVKRILVCSPQVPFVRGGAEILIDRLVQALQNQGFHTDLVSIPFQDWPHEALIRSASAWRLLELEKLSPYSADVVIATKFPSYFVSHPNKIVWLFHNYRPVYDLHGTIYSGYSAERPDDLQLIQWIAENDRAFLGESKKILTISQNVRNRLRRFLSLDAEVLYPPPPLAEKFYCAQYEPFIFVAQRLDPFKRTDLLLESMEQIRGDFHVRVAGTGPDEERLRLIVEEKRLHNRVQFLGRISDDQLLENYARCRAVFNAPYDEDYGFTTVEAFLSRKPVITAKDSGGSLEFVENQINGFVVNPVASDIAGAIQRILDNEQLARSFGEAGYKKVAGFNWDAIIHRFSELMEQL